MTDTFDFRATAEYGDLLDTTKLTTRDEHIAFDNALDGLAERVRTEAYRRGFDEAWGAAHDSCHAAVQFILDNYEEGLHPEVKIALQWAADRITFISYPSHETDTDNG